MDCPSVYGRGLQSIVPGINRGNHYCYMEITENSNVEELVDKFPGIVGYLGDLGLRCIVCGEPVWGTLGELARDKGFTQEQTDAVIKELNVMYKSYLGG